MAFRPHPWTLRQLQYAVAVAETGSFRQAAALCRVAQPSLSVQIQSLEDALGIMLFERTSRRVLVTAAGEALLVRARDALRTADDLVRHADLARDPFSGTLRIGVIPTISPYLLPAVAPALRAKWAALRVLWREDKTEVLIAALAEGRIEAAIVALEAKVGHVEHALVARDVFVLAVPLDHALAASSGPVALSEITDELLLLLEDGHCLRDQVLSVCATLGARESEFRATSLATLVQMVAAGLGITLLPQVALTVEAGRSPLVIRPFLGQPPERTIALVWRPGAALASALRAVGDVLRDAAKPAVAA